MEHPDITRMNQRGDTSRDNDVLDVCIACHKPLTSGMTILQLNGHSVCDDDCLNDAIATKPGSMGVERVTLD